ncbi:MAG TPA: hypothetical protein PLI47_01510 [Bacteroidia bacterium]|jgi:hypothetical protein|nr:hypothetical protein [Bacteroidota bacterium]MBP9790041.1 hypothetical protein [Bacteroidia bacterium]MBK7431076.1 hypothetical protein [Bacteroidota bacterium]MBK7571020.1 hypothetical protein [Bacteroidota bacterium]MBP9923043.1 hypothetical protein [Bacteroidia bacterium]
MKLKLLVVLVAICSTAVEAQHKSKFASVKWGPELEGSKKGSITDFLGYDDNAFYLSAYEKSDAMIEKIDKNLSNPLTITFEEKDKATKEKYELHSRGYFANKLYMFKTNVDKDTKTTTLYAEEVNSKNMTSKGKLKKLSEITYEKRRDKGGFSIVYSPSETYMMVIESIPTDKEENEQFNVAILDSSLNLIWRKNLELPYLNTLFFRQKFIVGDDGNFYVLGKLYKDKVKTRVKGMVNYMYHVIAYGDNGDSKIDYEIKLGDNYITDITFSRNSNGDIISAGFYSKKGLSSVDGSFFLTLDPITKAVKASNMKEFDMEFMTEYMSEKDEKKAKKREEKGKDDELYQYDLRTLVKREDGGVMLIGEQFFINYIQYRCGNSYCTRTDYYYNDIIVVNIDPTGKIEWAKKIPKRQISTNDGGFYSSFAMAVNRDRLSFIYNDHKDNMDMEKTKRLKNFNLSDRNGVVVLATMDDSGKLTREILLDNTETEVIIRPKVCEQFDDDHMLLFGERKKMEQFAIITFN